MNAFVVVALIIGFAGLLLLAFSMLNAPEAEENEHGFQVVGPSVLQRFWRRFRARRQRRRSVGEHRFS